MAERQQPLDAPSSVDRSGEGEEAEVLIELKDVYKSFGEKHILKGASFKVRQGHGPFCDLRLGNSYWYEGTLRSAFLPGAHTRSV